MAIPFAMHGEYVELDQLLKASGFCEPGGATLAVIAEGQIKCYWECENDQTAVFLHEIPGVLVDFGKLIGSNS